MFTNFLLLALACCRLMSQKKKIGNINPKKKISK